jgi:hypothetical protein
MNLYDAIECSFSLSLSLSLSSSLLLPMIESMNEYAKKKEKNLSIECDSRLYYMCAYAYNSLEHLFELVVVALNGI